MPTKFIYRTLVQNDRLLESKVESINRITNLTLNCKEMSKIITNITKITNYVKLRSFQYRLLCNAVITNKHLYRYKIKENDLCSFCTESTETVMHLLYTCKYVKPLWGWISDLCQIKLNFANILLNNVMDNPSRAENCVVLLTKFYIYRTRCLGERLSKTALRNYIKDQITIEGEIARISNKTAIHNIKWSHLIDKL